MAPASRRCSRARAPAATLYAGVWLLREYGNYSLRSGLKKRHVKETIRELLAARLRKQVGCRQRATENGLSDTWIAKFRAARAQYKRFRFTYASRRARDFFSRAARCECQSFFLSCSSFASQHIREELYCFARAFTCETVIMRVEPHLSTQCVKNFLALRNYSVSTTHLLTLRVAVKAQSVVKIFLALRAHGISATL